MVRVWHDRQQGSRDVCGAVGSLNNQHRNIFPGGFPEPLSAQFNNFLGGHLRLSAAGRGTLVHHLRA